MSTFNLRAGLIDIFAGAVCSVLSVAYCLSYAALIFTGPLEHFCPTASRSHSCRRLSAERLWRCAVRCPLPLPDRTARSRSLLPRSSQRSCSSLSPAADRSAWSGAHRHVAGDRADGTAALYARLHPCRTCDPFRTLSGDRRLSRRNRLADGHRRHPGRDQSASDARQSWRVRRRRGDRKLAPAVAVAALLFLLRRRSKNPFILPGVLVAAFSSLISCASRAA